MIYDLAKTKKIFVAGHRGLVGSAIVRTLQSQGYGDKVLVRTRAELDLLNQAAVREFLKNEKPDSVIIAAAKVGGIHANKTYPVEFLYENIALEMNLIQGAAEFGVEKLLFLGSSCIYPKFAEQPIREESLLTGALEPTNEAYAIAKIAGLKLCEYYFREYGKKFISAMPTNLYGPGDNFHPENSHVIPGMMRRFHEANAKNAPSVTIWGTGTPKREFLHVDDLAEACLVLLEKWNQPQWLNVGTGTDLTIHDLAKLMAKVTGFQGKIELDSSKPDGTPRKILDVSKIHSLGWKAKIDLESGLKSTYTWALNHNIF